MCCTVQHVYTFTCTHAHSLVMYCMIKKQGINQIMKMKIELGGDVTTKEFPQWSLLSPAKQLLNLFGKSRHWSGVSSGIGHFMSSGWARWPSVILVWFQW